jgi:hypothetical protein
LTSYPDKDLDALVRIVRDNAGAAGAGAHAELTARQILATERVSEDLETLAGQMTKAEAASQTQSTRLVQLTLAIVVFTVMLAVIGIAQLVS